MKHVDGWYWPDSEQHMPAWMMDQRNRMLLNGRSAYQGKKQVAVMALCKSFRTAIDIGAHVGTWAHNLAASFQLVRCFEPVSAHRDCFARNVEAQNVIMYPMALGDVVGRVSMFTGPASTGDTYVDPKVDGGDVDILRLDDFEFADVDLIKIDAEGFEEKILRGGEETLRRCMPVLCVEQKRNFPVKFGLKPQGAVVYLESLGYVVAKEIGGDYMMVRK